MLFVDIVNSRLSGLSMCLLPCARHGCGLGDTIFVAVSRRYGSGFSQRPCVCTMSAAFDGRSASCGTAKDQNSTSLVSHRIYLGGCHFNPTSGCQVSEHNMSKWVLMKS